MQRGAAELKEVLMVGKAANAPVVVVWTRGSERKSQALRGAVEVAAAGASSFGVGLLLADVAATKANERLAEALGAKPVSVYLYRQMKLERRLTGPSATVEAFQELLGTIQGRRAAEQQQEVAKQQQAAVAGEEEGGAGNAGAQELAEATGCAPSAHRERGSEDLFAPPSGKFARPGAIKRLSDGHIVHFFPRMPCLR